MIGGGSKNRSLGNYQIFLFCFRQISKWHMFLYNLFLQCFSSILRNQAQILVNIVDITFFSFNSEAVWKPVSQFPALYMKAICFPVSGCIWKLYVSRFPGVYESYMFPGFRVYMKAICFPVSGCILKLSFLGFRLYMKAIVFRFEAVYMKAICFLVSGFIWKLYVSWFAAVYTVKPLITNTSKEFIKCRLENFSMSFMLYYVNFSIWENK